MKLLDTMRMGRTAFEVNKLSDQGKAVGFWAAQSIEDRFKALELCRQIAYGYDPNSPRLQRILTIIERPKD